MYKLCSDGFLYVRAILKQNKQTKKASINYVTSTQETTPLDPFFISWKFDFPTSAQRLSLALINMSVDPKLVAY